MDAAVTPTEGSNLMNALERFTRVTYLVNFVAECRNHADAGLADALAENITNGDRTQRGVLCHIDRPRIENYRYLGNRIVSEIERARIRKVDADELAEIERKVCSALEKVEASLMAEIHADDPRLTDLVNGENGSAQHLSLWDSARKHVEATHQDASRKGDTREGRYDESKEGGDNNQSRDLRMGSVPTDSMARLLQAIAQDDDESWRWDDNDIYAGL